MRNLLKRGAPVLLVIVTAIAVGVFVGCSSSETDKTETATTETQETMAEATETATETAVDFASYANPKEGVCPACGMKVSAEHLKVAKINDKEYACCSAGCVAMITEDPDKYLAADASEPTGHEGHNH